MANGVRLAWLIDPETRSVWVHEPGRPAARLTDPETIDGGDVLPGFNPRLNRVW